MLHLVVAVISMVAATLGAPATTTTPVPTTCPFGMIIMMTTTTGQFWYTCTDYFRMSGCVSDEDDFVRGGEIFKSNG